MNEFLAKIKLIYVDLEMAAHSASVSKAASIHGQKNKNRDVQKLEAKRGRKVPGVRRGTASGCCLIATKKGR